MNDSIQKQATAVFDKIEKWKAFHEMEIAIPSIIKHWRTIGAEALRKEFNKTTGGWECTIWGNPMDTKWYLSELGEKSISIGIGWETEFHLFDGRNNDTSWQKAADLLEQPDFKQLISRIGPRCYRSTWQKEKLLLADLQFDPFGMGLDPLFRHKFIVWKAAHETDAFVEATLRWVRQYTEDKEMVRLIRDLNDRSSTKGE